MGSETVGYVGALRRKVGHDPLIMACAGCAVFDSAGRLLLQQPGRRRRPPRGLPGGAMELGETIEAAVRETLEETGLRVRPGALLGVYTGDAHTHANADVTQSVVVCSRPPPTGGG